MPADAGNSCAGDPQTWKQHPGTAGDAGGGRKQHKTEFCFVVFLFCLMMFPRQRHTGPCIAQRLRNVLAQARLHQRHAGDTLFQHKRRGVRYYRCHNNRLGRWGKFKPVVQAWVCWGKTKPKHTGRAAGEGGGRSPCCSSRCCLVWVRLHPGRN